MRAKRTVSANVRMWRRSMTVIALVVVLGFSSVVVSLVNLQFFQAEELQRRAVNQQLRDTTIPAARGNIYDRNMKILAQSTSAWTVAIDPQYIRQALGEDDTVEVKGSISTKLAEILEMDQAEVLAKMEKKSKYEIIKKRVDDGVRDQINAYKDELSQTYKQSKGRLSAAIMLIPDNKRSYPFGAFAASILGFVGSENQGLDGIEAMYDEELTGVPGRIVSAKNARGTDMPFTYQHMENAIDGNSLVLSIDEVMQRIVERNMSQGVIDNKVAARGVAIMMDVHTGEILAMVNKEDYDPNDPFTLQDEEKAAEIAAIEDDEERKQARSDALSYQWRNKAISDAYEPGSVFKILTAAMAMEEGAVSDNDSFFCNGAAKVEGWSSPIKCHKFTGHGSQNFVQILQNSCNPGFIKLGQMIGSQSFYKYFTDFGLTEPTGIDLPGEGTSIYHKEEDLKTVQLAVSSFGQTFKITPIQMITAVAAVANGGNLVQPHVVKDIIDNDGNIVKVIDPVVKRQVLSQETAKKLCNMLETVVSSETGTGKNARVAGYKIAGKTGTSEKKDTTDPSDRIASFCGFAPADDPQVVLLVFFDDPKSQNKYGSGVAAPVFASIMNEVLPYMGIERNYTDEERALLDVVTPVMINLPVQEAENTSKDLSLRYKVMGDGEKIIKQIPEPGQMIPRNGLVVLYTDEASTSQNTKVPDFSGKSVSEVNYMAAQADLNISISGSALYKEGAVAAKQSISPGTATSRGTIIKIEFITKDTVE